MTHTIHAREATDVSPPPAIDRSPEAVGAHLEDAAHFPGGHAEGIARPRTEGEVAALVREAARVLPIGAQSSVTGGATPDGGVLLSTARLTTIAPAGVNHVRAGAGVSLDALQEWLDAHGLWYPPAPTFTGAFLGGVAATNAAGAATFKYGTTRDWVDGLTVVLSCGHILDLRRGETRADADAGFEIVCPCRTRRVRPGRYRMPDVPKCSAGYFAAPHMDLIDLFIGSEGTLGVIVDVTARVRPARPAVAWALIPATSESAGLALVTDLRSESQATWRAGDPRGLDVAAIESLDRRCLELLREDGVDRAQSVDLPADAGLLLLVQIELPGATTAAMAFEEIGASDSTGAPDTALVRLCRLLRRHGVFDRTMLAMPGDRRRVRQFLAVREAAPAGVNRRVGDATRTLDERIDKTAGDMIVPFDRFGDMLAMYRDGFQRRGLDYAIWGHISDGNVHPNVIPRAWDDVVRGREAILEFAQDVVAMGGSPLAEHGVGRSALKQRLLRLLYGDEGMADMRAIKRAMDPDGTLAPDVMFATV